MSRVGRLVVVKDGKWTKKSEWIDCANARPTIARGWSACGVTCSGRHSLKSAGGSGTTAASCWR
jgi:hypothetical protein